MARAAFEHEPATSSRRIAIVADSPELQHILAPAIDRLGLSVSADEDTAHADVVRVGKDLLKAIQALKAVQLTVRGVGKITAHAEKNAREQHEVYGRDA